MTHFGDPEAHRKLLEEVSTLPEGGRLMGYFRAAVMGSVGSSNALKTLRETPGQIERASPLMRLQLAILALTTTVSRGDSGVTAERVQVGHALQDEYSRLAQAQQRVMANGVNVSSAASLANLRVGSSTDLDELTMVPGRLEQMLTAYQYLQAYVNYLEGFTVLWNELFGPNYWLSSEEDIERQQAMRRRAHRVDEDGGDTAEPSPLSSTTPFPCDSATMAVMEEAVEEVAQFPPHMYAVNWGNVLSQERRLWFRGLYQVTKEVLARLVTRELPLEMYFAFALYANLTLRVRLLETAAELFVWSAAYVDVGYCVQQLFVSYRAQQEMARLQDVWGSFQLFDADFVDECVHFNYHCSQDQGAILENMCFTPPSSSASTPRREAQRRHSRLHHRADSDSASHSGSSLGREDGVDGGLETTDGQGGESTRQSAELDGRRGVARWSTKQDVKKEVYVPLFYTRCHFMWLLQRFFWSMYGRCSLQFSSCIHIDLAPTFTSHPPFYLGEPSQQVNAAALPTDAAAVGLEGDGASDVNVDRRCRDAGEGGATGIVEGRLPRLVGREVHRVRSWVQRLRGCTEIPSETDMSDVTGTNPDQRRRALTEGSFLPSRLSSAAPVSGVGRGNGDTARVGGRPTTWRGEDGPGHSTLREPDTATATTTTTTAPSTLRARATRSLHSLWQAVHRATTPAHATAPAEAVSSFSVQTVPPLASLPSVAERASPGPREGEGEAVCVVPPLTGAAAVEARRYPPQGPFFLHYTNSADDSTDSSDTAARSSLQQQYQQLQRGAPSSAERNESSLLTMSGCYVLTHAIRAAVEHPAYPSTLLVLTDNTTRPGRMNWKDHRLALTAIADDPNGRYGITPWVINFIAPRTRVSTDAAQRARQEQALLLAIVFRVAGTEGERISFSHLNSAFFVLNSGPHHDGGRLYYVLHLHLGLPETRPGKSEASVLAEEKHWAFGALEDIRSSWVMTTSCNEGVRLGRAFTDEP